MKFALKIFSEHMQYPVSKVNIPDGDPFNFSSVLGM